MLVFSHFLLPMGVLLKHRNPRTKILPFSLLESCKYDEFCFLFNVAKKQRCDTNSILSAISQNYYWSKGQLISHKHAVSNSKNIKFDEGVGINEKKSTIHNQRKHNLASIKLHYSCRQKEDRNIELSQYSMHYQ